MREAERIANQLRRAYRGEAWHGPALRELLEGVTAERAAARPLPGAHSIWELVLHVAAWQGVVLRRVGGEDAREPEEGDWSDVAEPDEARWREALARLDESTERLIEAVTGLADSRLEEGIGRATLYAHLHGIIQHNLYHAGQIALLKKI